MGILEWIEEKARKKMRLAQIKILYQNVFAVEFLIQAPELPFDEENLNSFLEIRDRSQALTIELSDADMLEDTLSEGLFEDNKTLKNIYAAMSRAPNVATGPAEAIDFVERFKPVAGWKSFSDADWDAVLNGLQNTQ